MKYDVSSVGMEEESISSAQLLISVLPFSKNAVIKVSKVSNDWNKDTLTWHNSPENEEWQKEFALPSSSEWQTVMLDVSDIVEAAEGTEISFCIEILSEGGTALMFSRLSSDIQRKPRMVISFDNHIL